MSLRVGTIALAGLFAASLTSAATFVVDSAGDEPDADTTDGLCRTALSTCTLRAAIEQANASPGADVIQFDIPGAGVHTISPASPLSAIADDAGLTIDGYTQPGASPNTLTIGDDASLMIEVEGSGAGASAVGFRIVGANVVLRGLVVNRFGHAGVSIEGGFGHRIVGCFIGTDPSGTQALPNLNAIIVNIESVPAGSSTLSPSTQSIQLGTAAVGDRNLVSGNRDGITAFAGPPAVVHGNYVGVDRSGAVALPNDGFGVSLGMIESVVGGLGTNEGNVISGNGVGLIASFGRSSVVGNQIGYDASGSFPVPNNTGVDIIDGRDVALVQNRIVANAIYGIEVAGSTNVSIFTNTIGAAGAGMGNGVDGIIVVDHSARIFIQNGNDIAFNGGSGIRVGVTATDSVTEVLVDSNSIHDNSLLGIDLGGNGVSANNDCDTGRGPNLGQNYPVLDFAAPVAGGLRLVGSLNSVPGFQYRLDFYMSSVCDPSGFGEGEVWIGSADVTSDSECLIPFDIVVVHGVPSGWLLTATATDPAGNTSEFSACRPLSVGEQFYTVPPCRIVDTRDPAGPYGGPSLGVVSDRTFVIPGRCGVPNDAQAVALNVAVTQPTNDGHLILFASGTPVPVPPAVNYSAGQTRARDGIFALGLGGGLDAHVHQTAGTVHLVLDVTGYFR